MTRLFLMFVRLSLFLSFSSTRTIMADETIATNTTSNEELCNAETVEINTNADVLKASTSLRDEVEKLLTADAFADFCSIIRRKCTLDLADYSSEMKTQCATIGGQFVELDQKLGCDGQIVGSLSIPGSVEILNVPGCIGQSCDSQNFTSDIQDTLTTLITDAEEEIEKALGDRIDCEPSSGNKINSKVLLSSLLGLGLAMTGALF
mmetsp:Transcript_18541/g.22262  ORF Transcript_18541/g.22262 Transcript_18541/m.22262 type:complete len:206 (-) Transcript_18541:97-714(-)